MILRYYSLKYADAAHYYYPKSRYIIKIFYRIYDYLVIKFVLSFRLNLESHARTLDEGGCDLRVRFLGFRTDFINVV